MVKFKFSFLLAFDFSPPKPNAKSKKEKKEKKLKNKNKIPVPVPDYVINLNKPIGTVAIEYDFFPKVAKYHVDVICWGPVAKIFSVNGEIIIKCIVFHNISWVPVVIFHNTPDLDNVELLKYHKQSIKFVFQTLKNKLGKLAKKDKTKVLYLKKEDVCVSNKFRFAFNYNPNESVHEHGFNKEKIVTNQDIQPEKKIVDKNVGNSSELTFLGDLFHKYKIYKILKNKEIGKGIKTKTFVPPCKSESSVEKCDIAEESLKEYLKYAKGKKGKKGKKEKEKKSKEGKDRTKKNKKGKAPSAVEIIVPAEVFFTEPNYSLFHSCTPSNGLLEVYMLTTVMNLMSDSQRETLNPFIIKVHKLSNLPIEFLQKLNLTSVSVYINIPEVAQCVTNQQNLNETVNFNESHVHFLGTPSPFPFIELIRTHRLRVELRGISSELPIKDKNHLFGKFDSDFGLSKRSKVVTSSEDTRIQTKEVILAAACYDLTPLLKQPWRVKFVEPLHSPNSFSCVKSCTVYDNYEFQDLPTVNEINLRQVSRKEMKYFIPEELLLSCGTALKLSVTTFYNQKIELEVLNLPNLYRRILMEIYDVEFAATLLTDIIEYNQEILGVKILPFDFGKSYKKDLNVEEESEDSIRNYESVITGFLLDNGVSSLLFLEGTQLGYITHLWQRLMSASALKAKILFNSQSLFQKRIYTEFIKSGGIYIITLSISLSKILNKTQSYIPGNIPAPCMKALRKIDIILNSHTFKKINQFSLYPTAKELMSLDIEWGTALTYGTKYRSQLLMMSVS